MKTELNRSRPIVSANHDDGVRGPLPTREIDMTNGTERIWLFDEIIKTSFMLMDRHPRIDEEQLHRAVEGVPGRAPRGVEGRHRPGTPVVEEATARERDRRLHPRGKGS